MKKMIKLIGSSMENWPLAGIFRLAYKLQNMSKTQ